MSGPKILVTGAYGLVGSRIIKLWGEWGEIIATNRDTTPFELPNATFRACDITDQVSLQNVLDVVDPDVVLHLAAMTDVDSAEREKGNKNALTWQVNVEGTRNIVKIAQDKGFHLCIASTDFVFGDDGLAPHDEKSPKNPLNWYGVTKAHAEDIALTYPKTAVMRFAYPFRAQFPLKRDFVASIVSLLKRKSLPPMFADQYITPTFIDDLAPAVKILLEKQYVGIVNLCGTSWNTPLEIAQMLAYALKIPKGQIKKGLLREYETLHPEYARRPLNGRTVSKFTQSLGITMQRFADTIPALRAQGLLSN